MNQILDYIQTHYLELIGSILGFYYLYLEYKASIWLWLVGFIMTTIYVYIYAQASLYGLVIINIYSLGITLYGGLLWIKQAGKKKAETSTSSSKEQSLGITFTSLKHWGFIVLGAAALYVVLYHFLAQKGGSSSPMMDSIVTALSFVGLFMLAHK